MRVWKDYTQKGKHRLATAWQTVQGHRPGARGISAVVDWQQRTGCLVIFRAIFVPSVVNFFYSLILDFAFRALQWVDL